jgi:8-oxo-dGTP pyrophosphatase MutT (NUDIX family)
MPTPADAAAPIEPRRAAAVFLARPRDDGPELEVLLVRRHRGASFMSASFVFPGGIADPGEDDPRLTAARELFEEGGVLLADRPTDGAARDRARVALHGGARFADVVAGLGAAPALDHLLPVARWITPFAERRRYDARFFVALAPAGQTPTADARETVDLVWVTPADALRRAGELRLPPPQIRIFFDLAEACAAGWPALAAEAVRRSQHPEPILPRLVDGPALLLPWDPAYATGAALDEIVPWPPSHPLATGPSRFTPDDPRHPLAVTLNV